jgi:hypothetical protein
VLLLENGYTRFPGSDSPVSSSPRPRRIVEMKSPRSIARFCSMTKNQATINASIPQQPRPPLREPPTPNLRPTSTLHPTNRIPRTGASPPSPAQPSPPARRPPPSPRHRIRHTQQAERKKHVHGAGRRPRERRRRRRRWGRGDGKSNDAVGGGEPMAGTERGGACCKSPRGPGG